jgi:enoyl-CoA hydratase/carnithine racemase
MNEGVVPAVLFKEEAGAKGARIGFATLNAEKTLNALSLEMIDRLTERLSAWARDPEIALVVLQGAGEKAFCAGADLHRLHRAILEHRASTHPEDFRGNQYALAFFGREYRLDYLIHTFPKPLLCWGQGIVMGGGVGLMMGASHRVVTEHSRIAMPEINIGLYPDVGGSWLLGRMPGKLGLFLALTAAQLAASDALFAGVADHLIEEGNKARVFGALLGEPWTGVGQPDREQLTDLLSGFAAQQPAFGPARRHFDLVNALCGHARLDEIAAAIVHCNVEDPWLAKATATLARGSPSTAALAYALQRRARLLSLADVFRLELVAAMNCVIRPDLAEGIRALLIDKDQRPRWQPATLAQIAPDYVEGYFSSPWEAADHPLSDLGSFPGPVACS